MKVERNLYKWVGKIKPLNLGNFIPLLTPANWSSLTFLGIGERAGNAELEKIVAFLIQRVEGFQKYNLRSVVEFAEFMEREIGITVLQNKSVVGRNVFSQESDNFIELR